ncbi:ATP-binding cassette domain-containing protein [Lacticaseibacillus yichunensis]|uniref:ATP-binding cassette domain-containing protein n=2 Tax=Bacilli TaxID=91061 RepID=A0ABW4CQP6_9LACO|nr:ABC transporter ATP-binding protein [Lacticaseibacillus yichunensis]
MLHVFEQPLCSLLVLTDYKRAKATGKMSIDLRVDISNSVITRSYSSFTEKTVGSYSSWMISDVALIEQRGFNNVFSVVQIISDPLFSIVALFSFHWSLVIVALIIGVVTVGIPQLWRKRLQQTNLETTKQNEDLYGTINDQLAGYETLYSLGLTKRITEQILVASELVLKKQLHQVRFETVASNTGGFINLVGQLVINGWTGFLIFAKLTPIGAINSTASLSYNVLNSLAAFNPILTQLQSLSPVFKKYELNAHVDQVGMRDQTSYETANDIEFSRFTYSYSSDKPALFHNLSFIIPKGSKTLIQGESGAGKSTLLRVLAGQIPEYTGAVMLCGQDLSHLSTQQIHEHVLYVSQSPHIFSASLLDNLLLGDSFTLQELDAALEITDLLELVSALPNGLDTILTENGKNLSGGQRQRIALARCLLRGCSKTCSI